MSSMDVSIASVQQCPGSSPWQGVRAGLPSAAVATILTVAAILKLHEMQLSGVRAWSVAQVAGEWLLALWLVSGFASRAARIVTLGCFAVFAGVTLFRGLRGDASCGCFGALSVSPWVTLGLDLVVIGLLVAWNPIAAPVPRWRWGLTAAVGALSLGAALVLGQIWRPATLDGDGIVASPGGWVVLEPAKWMGKKLPLLPHLSPPAGLAEGRWTVLLYKHGCPACVQAAARFGKTDGGEGEGRRLGLVELPPYGAAGHLRETEARGVELMRLSEAHDWFAQTPVYIDLVEGVVTGVRQRP